MRYVLVSMAQVVNEMIFHITDDENEIYHDLSEGEDEESSQEIADDAEDEIEVEGIRIPEQDDPEDLVGDHTVSIITTA